MKKLMSLTAAAMFVSAVAFAQVPEQNQQGTMPEQDQTTMPEQNQTQPQPEQSKFPKLDQQNQQGTTPQQTQPTLPEQNQSTTPQQDQLQGTTPEPNPEQTTTPQQQEEQQGGFPEKDTTSPAISDTTKPGSKADTSATSKPPKW